MKFRSAIVMIAVVLGSAACAGTDGAKSSVDVTDITAVGVSKPPSPGVPPVTAPVSQPPSVPSNATGPGLSGLALISDDFTQYANTAALQSNITANIGGTATGVGMLYNDGYHGELAEIDQAVRYNGHATMKYNMPGGSPNTAELWPRLPRPLSTMWLRVKIRFSPGFITTGTLTNSANAYKLLGWGYDDSYGSGRVEITNTTQYQLYYETAMSSGSHAATSTPAQFGIGGDVNTEWSDGGWYDYIVEYQNTSSTTSVARLWIAKDGSTPVLRATSTSTSLSGYTMSHIGYVMLGLNFNQIRAASQTQALWYGQWEVVDGAQHPNPFGLAGNY